MNRAVYTPYDFADYASEHAPDVAKRVVPLVAGDYVLKRAGRDELFWTPSTTAQYGSQLAAFLSDWASRNPTPASPRRSLDSSDVAFLERRLGRPEVVAQDYDLVFCRDDAPEVGFRVDMRTRTLALDAKVPNASPWMKFVLEPVAFDAWLSESIIFEVVLESARFTVYREPERHDPKIWETLRLYF